MSDIDVDKSLRYLATTDKEYADAKATVKYLEHKRKTIKAMQYLKHTDGTIQEKESKAYASQEMIDFLEEYKNAVYDEQILQNKRKSAELAIEVWRSENANRRKGNIT